MQTVLFISNSPYSSINQTKCFFNRVFFVRTPLFTTLAHDNNISLTQKHILLWSISCFGLIPVSSLLALLLAWYFYRQMMRESEGTPAMQKIASHVRQGAMSYLKQQYKIVGLVFLALVVLFSVMAYGFNLQNSWVPIAFLTGGFFSGLSAFWA